MADSFFYDTGPERLGLFVRADQSVDVAFEVVLFPVIWERYRHTWEVLEQGSIDKRFKSQLYA